jgi:hypothetical protein
MGVADWRAWTAQGGGSMPTAPNPPGTPYVPNSLFPGVLAIPDLINMTTSIPPYPGLSSPGNWVTINAVDPFGGWTDQKAFVANSAGAQVPTMRPSVPGLTSP